MEKCVVFDLEATGKRVTDRFRVGCLKYSSVLGVEVFTNVEKFVVALGDALEEGYFLAGHNILTYDLPLLCRQYYRFQKAIYRHPLKFIDTLLLSRREFPKRRRHSLDSWGVTLGDKKIVVDDWENATEKELINRCVQDVRLTENLLNHIVKEVGPKSLGASYYPWIIDMMAEGVPYNIEVGRKVYANISNIAEYYSFKARGELENWCPGINLNSNAQVHKALIKRYGEGLPMGEPSEKTKKCSPLFNKGNANSVVAEFPILRPLQKARELKGLVDYLKEGEGKKSLPNKAVNVKDGVGRIFPTLSLFGSVTGRNQYSSPPLNQVAIKVRQAITAPKGWLMLGVDISSLEMAIFGLTLEMLSGDRSVLNDLENGVCPKQKTVDYLRPAMDAMAANNPKRDPLRVAKTVNYGHLYGQHPWNTCQEVLGLNPEIWFNEVESGLKARFPGSERVKKLLEEMNRQDGYIKTMFGHKLTGPDHVLLNYFVQSTGAEYALIKLGLINNFMVNEAEFSNVTVVRPFLQNHDEGQWLVWCSEKKMKERVVPQVEAFINGPLAERFKALAGIPLITGAEVKWGHNWEDTH